MPNWFSSMPAYLEIDDQKYTFDAARPIDISIPLQFNGPQPNAYGVEAAASVPCAAGELVGDTRQGGSCNFEQYTFIPHCNGTHTECVGHITHERISIRDCLRDVLLSASLISIEPENAQASADSYAVDVADSDLHITRRLIEEALNGLGDIPVRALIIRSLPNDDGKLTRRYADDIPPYLTTDAMELIVKRGIEHLLVDLPSIDRLYDDGKLSNHRIFWNVGEGSFEVGTSSRKHCTITELIYVPDEVPDGNYILNLQVAPFAADTSPSRPLLFRLVQK